jgi:ribosomal protein L7/L12
VDVVVVISADEQTNIRSLAQQIGVRGAIKHTQTLTGASLDRSRELVKRILAGASVPATAAEADALRESLVARAREVRDTDGKIAAIRLVQSETALSLDGAKSFVDALD